jgi:hypothetical protein
LRQAPRAKLQVARTWIAVVLGLFAIWLATACPAEAVEPLADVSEAAAEELLSAADSVFVTDESGFYDAGEYGWYLFPRVFYRSYLAGAKESRMRLVWTHERDEGWLWDVSLGGRAGILRYGTPDGCFPAQGWQLDVEGAAFPRLDPDENMDLVSSDFRFGLPLTYAVGPWQYKFGYYHLSSHLGDEYLLNNGLTSRYNYSRDVLIWGASWFASSDVRLYAEAGWAFYSDVAEPWEFQVGVDYSPVMPTWFRGAPFAAVNGHLREEIDFGGNLVVQTGWQWRDGPESGLFRIGVEYFHGQSEQFEFFNRFEEKIGLGVWYDF